MMTPPKVQVGDSMTGSDDDDGRETEGDKEKGDKYWNYKVSEFMVDSLNAISTVYERTGDGCGMLIQSKVLLSCMV